MGSKYSVGDKVFTTYTWSNGMGLVIPKDTIVEIRRIFKHYGVNTYDCIYNTDRDSVIYEEYWLGRIYNQPQKEGLRPCKFSTDWITESVGDMYGNRSVEVIQEGKTYDGYFHRFTDGGKGIVERLDGKVYEVRSDSIVFNDRDYKD